MLRGTPTVTFDYLVKQLPTATAFINKKYEVVYVSDRWINDFDFTRKEVIGRSLKDIFGKVTPEWEKVLKDCLKGISHEVSLHPQTDELGNQRWFEWTNTPWYDEKENIIGVILQTEDVTYRIRTEIQAKKLENLFDTKSEITNIGSWEYDVERNHLTWCEITKKLHEVVPSYEPQIDTAISFYKEGYSRNTIALAVDKAIQEGEPYEVTCEII
uniref:PAS domain-containing protein n=1 Tax=Muriicola sp. TaxID=2020856 RepID=UPI0035619829